MSSPIGGFMPIPLAMMIPFMAAQSLVMGDSFGKGFQFGKRKISAMSNEEFNSLTMSNLITNLQQEFKQLIPSINMSIEDSKDLQTKIVQEMLKIVPNLIATLTETLGGQPGGGVIIDRNPPLPTPAPSGTVRSPGRPTTFSPQLTAQNQIVNQKTLVNARANTYNKTLRDFKNASAGVQQRMRNTLDIKKRQLDQALIQFAKMQQNFKDKYGFWYKIP